MDYKLSVDRRLLESGLWCFQKYGFHGSSIDDIVLLAQVAKSSFYHYYHSKKVLLEYCLKYKHNAFMNEWRDARVEERVDDPIRKIVQLFESRIQREFRDDFAGCIFVQIHQEFIGNWEGRNDPVLEVIRKHNRVVKDTIRDSLNLMRSFSEAEVEEKTDIIYFLYEGAGIDAVISREFAPLRVALKIVREQVLRGSEMRRLG